MSKRNKKKTLAIVQNQDGMTLQTMILHNFSVKNKKLSHQTWLKISSSLVIHSWLQLEKDLPSKVYDREWPSFPPSAIRTQHPNIFTSVNFKARCDFPKTPFNHSICKSVVLLHTDALSYWFHPWSQKDGIVSLTKIKQSVKKSKKQQQQQQHTVIYCAFFSVYTTICTSNFHLMREDVSCHNSWLYLVLTWQKSSSCHLKMKTEKQFYFSIVDHNQ